MPKISLGPLTLDFEASPTSALTKYFRNILSLRSAADGNGLAAAVDKPLKDIELDHLAFGFQVEQDVDVGGEEVEWKIEAGTRSDLRLFKTEDEPVLGTSTFGDGSGLSVAGGDAYVSFGLEGQIGSNVERETGDLTFGFGAEKTLTVTNYRRFAAATTLRTAFTETLQNFLIPGDYADLMELPEGGAMTVEGRGALRFSVSGEFGTSATVFATEIPSVDAKIEVTSGASASVSLDAEASTAYQIRAIRNGKKVLLGVYNKDRAGVAVSVGAQAGVAARIGEFDLTNRLLRAISKDVDPDEAILETAGLSVEQQELIAEVITSGVNRNLEASLELGFKALRMDESAFLWSIEPNKTDDKGRDAIRQALDGDLRSLTAEGASFPGIVLLRTIVTESIEKESAFRFNLFGIFNFVSVKRLLAEGEVLYEPVSGHILVTDKATASRVRASVANFADAAKLRSVVAESFLITAAYLGNKVLTAPPELTACHWYYEQHAKTSLQALKDHFDVAVALETLSPAAAQEHVESWRSEGQSGLYAETKYLAGHARALFFRTKTKPLEEVHYVEAGRRSLELLVRPGDLFDELHHLATRQDVWDAVQRAGALQATTSALAHFGFSEVQANRMHSYWSAIVFWAEAMVQAGSKLLEVEEFFKQRRGGVDRDDKDLTKLRKQLRKRLIKVVDKTKGKFGEPWGLLAADVLSGRVASAEVRVVCDDITRTFRRKRGADV
ncbi:MAG: hypothetical protein WD733_03010 [Bryobacterales bacterium]